MLAWSEYCDRQRETDRRANALCHPQRCTNRRANGQSSQHLFLPLCYMPAPSCGLRYSRRNHRPKRARLFSSIPWRTSKRTPGLVQRALPEQEPLPIDAMPAPVDAPELVEGTLRCFHLSDCAGLRRGVRRDHPSTGKYPIVNHNMRDMMIGARQASSRLRRENPSA
jgi:hypothetical protein